MDYASSDPGRTGRLGAPLRPGHGVPPLTPPATPRDGGVAPITSTKIVVSGGFGVGKTTLVGSVSEIEPLTTESVMTVASESTDRLDGLPDKVTTTVALDFGRVTLESDLVLYLFGTPGQGRFQFMWDDLVRGAVGALVLVDTRRVEDCFPAVDYFERSGLPFVVAINTFDGSPIYPEGDLREALSLRTQTPLIECDARDRRSSAEALASVVMHALRMITG